MCVCEYCVCVLFSGSLGPKNIYGSVSLRQKLSRISSRASWHLQQYVCPCHSFNEFSKKFSRLCEMYSHSEVRRLSMVLRGIFPRNMVVESPHLHELYIVSPSWGPQQGCSRIASFVVNMVELQIAVTSFNMQPGITPLAAMTCRFPSFSCNVLMQFPTSSCFDPGGAQQQAARF